MRIDLPSKKKMSFYASGPLPLYDDLFLCLQTGRWDEFLLPALYYHLTKLLTVYVCVDISFSSCQSQW